MAIPDILWAVDQKLPSNEKLVLIMLANRKNGKTGRCNPSIKTLCDECGIKKTALLSAIKGLEEKSLIKIIRQREGLVNLPNQYELSGSPLDEPLDRETNNGSPLDERRGSPLDEPKPVNTKPGIEPKRTITTPTQNFENLVPPEECELTVEKFGGELQACFEWAKEHEFWNFVAHESISKFLKLYGSKKPDGLRAQFERRNEPKKTTTGGKNAPSNKSTSAPDTRYLSDQIYYDGDTSTGFRTSL